MELAYDSIQWRASILAALKLRVLIKQSKIFYSICIFMGRAIWEDRDRNLSLCIVMFTISFYNS
jgi:hypothetical protein